MKHLLTIATIALLLGAAIAQDRPHMTAAETAEANKWMNMYATGGGGEWASITIAEVQKELKLSDSQKQQIEKLLDNFKDDMLKAIQDQKNAGKNTFATRQAYRGKVDGVLNAQQRERYRQINIQLLGMSAVLDVEVQKAMNFSEGDRKTMRDVYTKHHEALWNSYSSVFGSSYGEIRQILSAPQQELDRDLAKALTASQKNALEKLGGEKIKLPPSTPIYRALRHYRLP